MANRLKCSFLPFSATAANLNWLFAGSGGFTTDRWGTANAGLRVVNTSLFYFLPNNPTGMTSGFGYKTNDLGFHFSYFNDGSTTHLTFMTTASEELRILRGTSTVLATSSAGIFSIDTWYYVERQAVIADAGGTAEIRLNGDTVASFTGDTRNGASAQINNEELISGLAVIQEYCDWYINDNTGGAPDDDFWGDTRMYVLLPTGAGDVDQWTPTGAATNWEAVDNIPVNTAIYSSDGTPGDEVRFTHEALPSVSVIRGVDVWALLDKSDTGSRTAAPLLESNGVTEVSDDDNLNASAPLYRRLSLPLNPDGDVAWTTAGVNSAQPGARVIS